MPGATVPGHGQEVAVDDAQQLALERILDGARLWGLELEPRYRVLAATVEPTPERHPQGEVDDRRLQVLFFPVSTLLASLRRVGGDTDGQVETFTVEQLLDVVTALDGPEVTEAVFGRPEPVAGEWGPAWSLEGRSNAPDGRLRSLRLSVRGEDRSLGVYARFDDVEVRDADGDPVAASRLVT